MPILSIVIANFNYGRFLPVAIESVLNQLGFKQRDARSTRKVLAEDVELIIIDGGSTDNSVEVIKKYTKGLPPGIERNDPSIRHLHLSSTPITYWISEPDRGQSHAFNKGFAHAHGKYLTWLNADDVFMPGCLAKIIRKMQAHPDCHWFTGNFIRFLDDDKRISDIGWGPHWFPRILQRRNAPLVIFGPTTFFSREIYEALGPIDERLHLMMDIDLWQRFVVAGVKQIRLNMLVWAFRMHEDSKTAEFGEHALDAKRASMFSMENQMSYERTGYRCSKLQRVLCLVLRILDGSFLVCQCLRWNCRRFEIGGVA